MDSRPPICVRTSGWHCKILQARPEGFPNAWQTSSESSCHSWRCYSESVWGMMITSILILYHQSLIIGSVCCWNFLIRYFKEWVNGKPYYVCKIKLAHWIWIDIFVFVGGWTFFFIICGQKQYRDAVKLMENISTFKKRVQYAHYRPNVSISADKNAWWKYTYAAITEQRRRARYMIPILFDVSNSYWKNKIIFRLQFHQLLSKLFSKVLDQQICVYICMGLQIC